MVESVIHWMVVSLCMVQAPPPGRPFWLGWSWWSLVGRCENFEWDEGWTWRDGKCQVDRMGWSDWTIDCSSRSCPCHPGSARNPGWKSLFEDSSEVIAVQRCNKSKLQMAYWVSSQGQHCTGETWRVPTWRFGVSQEIQIRPHRWAPVIPIMEGWKLICCEELLQMQMTQITQAFFWISMDHQWSTMFFQLPNYCHLKGGCSWCRAG